MNKQLRVISELDRVIHEPGRLMIIALLAVVKECDFLYLLHETEMNKGNLSSHLARLEEAGLRRNREDISRQSAHHIAAVDARWPHGV